MGLRYNHLIINGRSTEDLPFLIAIEKNSAPVKARKKNIYNELDSVSGLVVQTVDAWEPVERIYTFYMYDVTLSDVRRFKKFVGQSGQITPYNDQEMHYNYYSSEINFETMDENDAFHQNYQGTISFICEPFEYEEEQTVVVGSTITNYTSAPMYPRLTVYGNSSAKQSLTIGDQTMVFKRGPNPLWTIECKFGEQNVYDQYDQLSNSEITGDFFVIPPDSKVVIVKTAGITKIEMLARWGWL